MRHKCEDADTKPFGEVRGWLLAEDGRNGSQASNNHAGTNGKTNGPRATPRPADAETGPTPSDPDTDYGNGRRLTNRHGAHLRYISAWKKWFIWTGDAWQMDDTEEVIRRAKEVMQSMFSESL